MRNFQTWLTYTEALQAGDDSKIQDIGVGGIQQNASKLCSPNDVDCMSNLQRLKEMLGENYESFVQSLGSEIIKDKKFLEALKIITKNGQKIKLNKMSVPVMQLKPTQREIAMDKALKKPLADAALAQEFLKGGDIAVGGKLIVTGGGGQFIIDGHHRWARLYSVNPGAKIAAFDIGNMQAEDALKIVQVGIATATGGIPNATVAGAANLLTIDENTVKSFVTSNMKKDVKKVFKKYFAEQQPEPQQAPQTPPQQPVKQAPQAVPSPQAVAGQQQPAESFKQFCQMMLREGDISAMSGPPNPTFAAGINTPASMPGTENPEEELKTNQKIANLIWQNVAIMQAKNQPFDPKAKRDVMPQTGDAEGWEKRTTQDLLPQNAHHRPKGKLYSEWLARVKQPLR